MSNYNDSNPTTNEWNSEDDEWPSLKAIEDDDYFDGLYEGFGTRCQACYGSGLDRYEDVDCLTCWGEGVVYGTV